MLLIAVLLLVAVLLFLLLLLLKQGLGQCEIVPRIGICGIQSKGLFVRFDSASRILASKKDIAHIVPSVGF